MCLFRDRPRYSLAISTIPRLLSRFETVAEYSVLLPLIFETRAVTKYRHTMPKAQKVKHTPASREGKDSHLYTDDNPATTLHGTGFKDPETAQRTIELVSNRSLTYQFQTINTMYHRASGHPHKTPSIEAAMVILKEWIDRTYPAAKDSLRATGGFKPVLRRDIVAKYINRIREEVSEEERRFAEFYIVLPKGKRLANTLVKQDEPGGRDWERERYEYLDAFVPQGKEEPTGWAYVELWDDQKRPTTELLKCIAWAWSPVSEVHLRKLGA